MKFSVVIPVYNVAPYLRECLDSIFAAARQLEVKARGGDGEHCQAENHWLTQECCEEQSNRSDTALTTNPQPLATYLIEIICVDDGSTDGSGRILDEYVEKVGVESESGAAEFKVIHQQNAGVSVARNVALEIATGEYICFVDSDDAVVPEYFTVLASVVESNAPDIIRFSHQDLESITSAPDFELKPTPLTFRTFVGSTIAWNACYKREIIGDLRFESIPNGEDILFAAEAFMRAKKIIGIDAQLYRYRQREGSAVNTVSMRHFRSKCEMCRLLKKRIQHPGLRRNLRNHIAGEILPMIERLPTSEQAEGWRQFFSILSECAWGSVPQFVAGINSKLLARMLLGGEIKMRRCIAVLKSKIM